MAASRVLPTRPFFESIRKQGRRLARHIAHSDAAAAARARARLPAVSLAPSLRDAQLVVARENGFAGWRDLVAEVARRTGTGIEFVAGEARRAIHDNDTDRLRQLLAAHPALVSWRDEEGRTLLGAATESSRSSDERRRSK